MLVPTAASTCESAFRFGAEAGVPLAAGAPPATATTGLRARSIAPSAKIPTKPAISGHFSTSSRPGIDCTFAAGTDDDSSRPPFPPPPDSGPADGNGGAGPETLAHI